MSVNFLFSFYEDTYDTCVFSLIKKIIEPYEYLHMIKNFEDYEVLEQKEINFIIWLLESGNIDLQYIHEHKIFMKCLEIKDNGLNNNIIYHFYFTNDIVFKNKKNIHYVSENLYNDFDDYDNNYKDLCNDEYEDSLEQNYSCQCYKKSKLKNSCKSVCGCKSGSKRKSIKICNRVDPIFPNDSFYT